MKTMTSRERLLTAMRREQPDRVPFGFFGFSPTALQTFKKNAGDTDPDRYFGTDGRWVGYKQPKEVPNYRGYFQDLPSNARITPWGTAHVPGSVEHFTKMIYPLRNARRFEEILEYPLPDYTRPECTAHLKLQVEELHAQGHAVMGSMACTLFEWSWQLRGIEEFLTDLRERPEWAEALIDKWLAARLHLGREYAAAGVDILTLGDDVSMQTGMMISPEMWRRVFKPRMERIIRTARSAKNDLLIWYHSDGDIRQVVPDLIEIGVDILNPVQPECMDPAEMKRLYGDRLAFWGTMGIQSTFPFGTPEEMRRVVKERIETVGKGGGLYLAPSHMLEPEVPWANMKAFVDAVREFGEYS